MTKLTVFMPVYNSEKYLKKAIESILNQTFKDFELLIINDGSTDSSLEIIKDFKDNRIVVINNNKNKGLPYTRSKGLELAKGEYIALMDSDDISYKNRFKEEIEYLEKNKDVNFVSACCDFIINDNIVKNKNVNIERYLSRHNDLGLALVFRNIVSNSAAMFRREFINEHKIHYRSECFVAQDYAFWIDCLKYGRGYIIPKNLVAYRIEHDSITNKSIKHNYIERKKIVDGIRQRALDNLGFKLNKKQLEIFNRVFSDPKVDISFDDFIKVNEILNFMIDYNTKDNLVNNKKLIEISKFEFYGRIINSKLTNTDKFKLINKKDNCKNLKANLIANMRLFECLISKD